MEPISNFSVSRPGLHTQVGAVFLVTARPLTRKGQIMEAAVVAVVVAVVIGFIHGFRRAGLTKAMRQAEWSGKKELAEQTRKSRRTETLVTLSLIGVFIVLALIAMIASWR